MKEIKVRVTLTEELLGTASADPDIHDTYIASLAPDAESREEEVAALGVDAVQEKSMTVFPKENGIPFLWDYQIRGFFKDTCGALQRMKGEDMAKKSCAMKAYKKVIDGCIFVEPRKVLLNTNGQPLGKCQRPLRAQTAQGERIALACSETVPAGTTCEFTVVTPDMYADTIIEWLDYGRLRGFGQWRNSGKGRMKYEVLEIS